MPKKARIEINPDKVAKAVTQAAAKDKAETIAACIAGTLADMRAAQNAAKDKAAAKGKPLELRDGTPDDVNEVIPLEAWPILFQMAKEELREAIRAFIEGRIERDTLTKGQAFYLSLVEDYIIAKTPLFSITPGGEYPLFADAAEPTAGIIAKIFKIAPAAMRKYCEDIQKKIEADNAQFFPAMRPSAKDRAKQAAEALTESQTILNMLTLPPAQTHLIPHSKFDLFTPYMNDHSAATIDLWTDNVAYMKCKLPDGRIEPFDQDVERALSSLFSRYKDRYLENDWIGFSLEQIYIEANGIEDTAHLKISPAMLDKIRESVEKLRHSELELKAKDKDGVEFSEADFIISASRRMIRYPGQKAKWGYAMNRAGLLTKIEERLTNRLNATPEQLNIGTGKNRVSITPLSMTIRRILMREIDRIRDTAAVTPESRTITLAHIIEYEASPELVEYADGKPIVRNRRHILKTGTTKKEQEAIRNARRHRRELVAKELAHFIETGYHITAFKELPDKSGFIITTDKSERAARQIEKKDRQKKKIAKLTAEADQKKAKTAKKKA